MNMNNTEISAELKGHFLRLYQLAMTDGDFSPEEWKMLFHFAEQRGVPREALEKILMNPTGPIAIPEKVETRLEYLIDFAQMIWADGKVSVDERIAFIKYCRKFEFLDENIEQLTEFILNEVREKRPKPEILKQLLSDA